MMNSLKGWQFGSKNLLKRKDYMNNTHSAHCSVVIRCSNEGNHIYPKQLGSLTITNEKVELERCIDYTTGAMEEEFVRDH